MNTCKIFINYRREDSRGEARALYDRLNARFPHGVFMDVSVLEPGVDFVEAIDHEVSSCDVFVTIIGKEWVTATDASGRRRLDDPQDFVRLEIAAALKRNIPVIPALVGGASMPGPADLPPDLQLLLRRNAIYLTDQGWNDDVNRLIAALERVLPTTSKDVSALPQRRSWTRAAASAGALIAILVALMMVPRFFRSTHVSTSSQLPVSSTPDVGSGNPDAASPSAPSESVAGGRRTADIVQRASQQEHVAENTSEPLARDAASSTSWTSIVPVGNLTLKYQSTTGAAEVDKVDESGSHVIKTYGPGRFSLGWGIITNTPKGILYYNSQTGAGALGELNSSGEHTTLQTYPHLSPGWTNIVSTSKGVLYYNSQTGTGELVELDSGEPRTLRTYPQLLTGWTNIVSTPTGILFYNRNTGSGAVRRLNASLDLVTLKSYPDGAFAPGWTDISYTASGIRYRNSATGDSAIGYIDRNGNHVTR